MKKTILISLLIFFPISASAISMSPPSISVVGNVLVGEKYQLEKFAVSGNGDEGNFKVDIEFPNDDYYTEHNFSKPDKSWFKMKPQNFSLTKDSTIIIDVVLQIPFGAKDVQGKTFFAFISVSQDSKKGEGNIRMALAQKVQFPVSGKIPISRQALNSLNQFFKTNSLAMVGVSNGTIALIISGIIILFLVILGFRKKYKLVKR